MLNFFGYLGTWAYSEGADVGVICLWITLCYSCLNVSNIASSTHNTNKLRHYRSFGARFKSHQTIRLLKNTLVETIRRCYHSAKDFARNFINTCNVTNEVGSNLYKNSSKNSSKNLNITLHEYILPNM